MTNFDLSFRQCDTIQNFRIRSLRFARINCNSQGNNGQDEQLIFNAIIAGSLTLSVSIIRGNNGTLSLFGKLRSSDKYARRVRQALLFSPVILLIYKYIFLQITSHDLWVSERQNLWSRCLFNLNVHRRKRRLLVSLWRRGIKSHRGID